MTTNPDSPIPGQLDLIPTSPAAVEDARAAALAELQRLDLAALQYRTAALAELGAASAAVVAAVAELDEAAAEARAAGATWQQIADAVGMTRQSAHERWSR